MTCLFREWWTPVYPTSLDRNLWPGFSMEQAPGETPEQLRRRHLTSVVACIRNYSPQ